MIKRIEHLINFILWTTSLLVLYSCNHDHAVQEQLNTAETLLENKPDSALTILNGLTNSSIHATKKTAARYALLKSMALDKCLVDTTTFDVLQPALDYYIKNGTPDEQLRTYYYQGRIYQNRGDDDAAMRSFMNVCDLKQNVTDSLLLAHTLVAQGTLYLKQYKINEFVKNNIEAAKLYEAIDKQFFEIKSYSNALDGYIMQNNQTAADSLLSICIPLVQKNPDGEAVFFSSILSYTVEFCSSDAIKAFLDNYQDLELTRDETINFAQGYSKIGEFDKAYTLLSGITLSESILDSLKYASVKIDILAKQGKYEQALALYRNYSAMLGRYQKNLLSQDLLFSDKRHQLEMSNLIEIHKRDRIIGGTLCSILGLFILAGWLYYRAYRSKSTRILTEKANLTLKLEQENLRKEKENAILERNKKILEAEILEKEKKQLEAEHRLHELETSNLKLEIAQLEIEHEKLKKLQKDLLELATPIQHAIKDRLELLNGLLAKEISNNESYAKPYSKWIETIHNDKKKFMESTRLAFTASHPKFMDYLKEHGLTTDEINFLCLYAIGLRGKEIGEYLQVKRHYITSHEIRQKLGIGEHDTNLGIYIRRLIKSFE